PRQATQRRVPRRRVACLGLEAWPGGPVVLVDATPDLPSQAMEMRAISGTPAEPGRPVDAILLTHAHMGHYAGLVHLGREAAATKKLPLVATPRMCAFLKENKPWSRLMEWGHVQLEPLEPGGTLKLAPALTVRSIAVPHRNEDSDTVGYVFEGPERTLLYVPDTDSWSRWDRPVAALVERADIALLDGTFYDPGEVTWRPPEEIPHPTITESMDLMEALVASGKRRILFTHLNHSNPGLDPASEASAEIARRGFGVAEEGLELAL
ncbi:MAG TPA: MBL fold metallo-hydrolase, partial [Candidatus Saccharimonadales bacterium]|nr:MBL fold metallo-hydrolase [Candidatus Saccharimonadales bacterium]